jgi:hypothetical protein
MNNSTYNNTCNNPLALCKISTKEQFWLDNPMELIQNDNYTRIVPLYAQTINQKLNALTRMCFIMIILILMFKRGEALLFIPITLILLGIILKKFNILDKLASNKELSKILGIRQEERDEIELKYNIELKHDGDPHLRSYEDLVRSEEGRKDYIIESGRYDSDNHLSIGTLSKPSETLRKNPESLYTIDELIDYKKNTCRRPTTENPFMNPSSIEYGTEAPVACNADDESIKESIRVNFNHQLFRDVDEVFERENSQRQFYTMPNTQVPNQQSNFADWLYKVPTSDICKEDQTACLRYDDIRIRNR